MGRVSTGMKVTSSQKEHVMSNLLVVSNREPYEQLSVDGGVVCQHTAGGLVPALDPVLKPTGGAWVAWGSGDADDERQAKLMAFLFLLIHRYIDCGKLVRISSGGKRCAGLRQ